MIPVLHFPGLRKIDSSTRADLHETKAYNVLKTFYFYSSQAFQNMINFTWISHKYSFKQVRTSKSSVSGFFFQSDWNIQNVWEINKGVFSLHFFEGGTMCNL